jgi:hypothetical protein
VFELAQELLLLRRRVGQHLGIAPHRQQIDVDADHLVGMHRAQP